MDSSLCLDFGTSGLSCPGDLDGISSLNYFSCFVTCGGKKSGF